MSSKTEYNYKNLIRKYNKTNSNSKNNKINK